MANFASVDGLTPLGNNAWAESSASGPPTIGVPNAGSMGRCVVRGGTSNTDLTAELVNMITAQRVYQANAQTIKTEDSILQTLVNLR
jgi:flagellar hook protein FlgE